MLRSRITRYLLRLRLYKRYRLLFVTVRRNFCKRYFWRGWTQGNDIWQGGRFRWVAGHLPFWWTSARGLAPRSKGENRQCIGRSLRNRRKKVVLGHRFVGERDAPHFRHAFSNRTYFQPCGQIWFEFRSASSAGSWRKKKKKKESVLKHKSADMYVWRPNEVTSNKKLILICVTGYCKKQHITIT